MVIVEGPADGQDNPLGRAKARFALKKVGIQEVTVRKARSGETVLEVLGEGRDGKAETH